MEFGPGFVAVCAALMVTASSSPAGGQAAGCKPHWRIVSTPTAPAEVVFDGVAALSPTDVWAVGHVDLANVTEGVLEYWDGRRWSVRQRTPGAVFSGIAALDSSSVLTLGSTIDRWSGGRRSVFAHLQADSISVTSPTDVWMLANDVVSHWDGGSWATEARLRLPDDSIDGGASVIAADGGEVWVLGGFQTLDNDGLGITWHFDGKSWTTAESQASFEDISMLSPKDVWAVGSYPGPHPPRHIIPSCMCFSPAMVGHWNGRYWYRRPYGGAGTLVAVQALSPTDVWAVGGWGILEDGEVAVHWDGRQWTNVGPPRVKGRTLTAVSALNDEDVWAVGYRFHKDNGGTFAPLVEHYAC
jgi:hypothetical protein